MRLSFKEGETTKTHNLSLIALLNHIMDPGVTFQPNSIFFFYNYKDEMQTHCEWEDCTFSTASHDQERTRCTKQGRGSSARTADVRLSL